MPLITIDGKLYLSDEELTYLCSVKLMNEVAQEQPQLVAEAQAEEEIGYRRNRKQGMSVWPERYLIKKVRGSTTSKAWGRAGGFGVCEPGEESINGHIYGSPDEPIMYDRDGKPHNQPYADLSVVGPASLLGKIALELCRRLEIELDGDDRAARRGYMPRDEPWLEEDQDDSPAEE